MPCPETSMTFMRGRALPQAEPSLAQTPRRLEAQRSMASRELRAMPRKEGFSFMQSSSGSGAVAELPDSLRRAGLSGAPGPRWLTRDRNSRRPLLPARRSRLLRGLGMAGGGGLGEVRAGHRLPALLWHRDPGEPPRSMHVPPARACFSPRRPAPYLALPHRRGPLPPPAVLPGHPQGHPWVFGTLAAPVPGGPGAAPLPLPPPAVTRPVAMEPGRPGAGLRRPLAEGRFPPPSLHAWPRGGDLRASPAFPRALARPGRRTAAGEGRKRGGGGDGAFALPAPVRAPVRGRRCAAGGRRGDGSPPRPRGAAAAGDGGSAAAMGCLQSVACKARVRREQIVVSDVSATIEPAATAIEESSPVVLRYRTPYFRASARVLMPPIARRHTWVVGWIQACNHMEFYNTYSDLGV